MIKAEEFRWGNMIMHKQQHRIITLACGKEQLNLIANGELKDLFPVHLKPVHFLQAGFAENKDYPLLPTAREFVLVLPIQGDQKNTIHAYQKSSGECFARAMQNGLPVSNPVYHVHQLQNLYYVLVGKELGF